jgi:glycosyltransferase involved in cell wall biosynthesis
LLSYPTAAPKLDGSVWFALGLALILAVIALKSRLNQASMPLLEHRDSGDAPPDCMVVIPARNEAAIIARAVKSLPADSVIVVDDHSTDNTAEVAREAGAGVVIAPKLLSGMVGKPSACAEGARLLASRWIVFADADTWYEPGFLESAISTAEAGGVDFLSIYLRPAYESVAARILAPYAVALYFFGMNPRTSPAEAFNGQCILVKREPYEFVGGHGTVRQYLNEDLKLAALAQRHRMKFGVARAGGLGQVRIDPASFARDAHRFSVVKLWIGIRIMLAGLAFFLYIPAFLWLIAEHHPLLAAGMAIWPVLLLSGWYGWNLALLAPFGICGLAPRLLAGALKALAGRRVKWKGRVI